MALFIANLAFEGSPLLTSAKIGILVASLIAGLAGYALLRATPEMAPARSSREATPTGAR